MDDLKRLLTLMTVVHEGNLGDTSTDFERNVSIICGWDEERTRLVIQAAAANGLIERADSSESN